MLVAVSDRREPRRGARFGRAGRPRHRRRARGDANRPGAARATVRRAPAASRRQAVDAGDRGCTALLSGDSAAAIARRFALRESAVETYLKRAAVKLGFGGRHGLARWMPDEAGDGLLRLDRASPLIDA
ncbi:hypothetical protein [Burkholderia sp. BCC0405]|uniref:hypothetical protein n=1 Tax=Burkholderia sp. BCC0405 TaxID=2676298 RepID=UPI001FC810B6|nr:hypothetical protein [Burkholderia sp. BCC0405]